MEEREDDIPALTLTQQLFLQRLISSKILTTNEAKKLYNTIIEINSNSTNEPFERCISKINRSLTKGFGLEIKTISMNGVLYHGVVNKKLDKISTKNGCSSIVNITPHTLAYLKLILTKMFQRMEDSDDEDDERDGSMGEIEVINLKNELPEPHKKKITLEDAENVIHSFKSEKLLIGRKGEGGRRLVVGPRVYMELPDFVKNFASEDDMPQLVVY